MNVKAKKVLVIGGGLLACAALVWAISAQLNRPASEDERLIRTTPSQADVTAKPVQTPDIQINPQVTIPTETKPPVMAEPIPDQTDKTEQIIQSDPVRPTETPDFTPTQEQLDSGKVPTVDDAPPSPIPAVTPTQPTTGGSPGQVYFPGFGWVDQGSETVIIPADDMYENGNKVGTMD